MLVSIGLLSLLIHPPDSEAPETIAKPLPPVAALTEDDTKPPETAPTANSLPNTTITANGYENAFAILANVHPAFQEQYTDDLDDLIRRRAVRVLVSYSRTNFFIGDGQPYGFEYELVQQYQRYLKTRVRKRSWPVNFLFVPVPFDELLPSLVEGRGDLVAAGLTVTEERQKLVAFTKPYLPDIREVIVTAGPIDGIYTLDDLAGRNIYVDPATSYAESVRALNRDFAARGLKPIEITASDPRLATEDILEMVNAGIVEITIADEHLADIWSKILPNLAVRQDLAVRTGGHIAWAVRKDNPEFLRSINRMIDSAAKGTLVGNVLFKRYFHDTRWLHNPTNEENIGKLFELRPLFEKYARQYGFDWLVIAAVAFQESRFNPKAHSRAGAVGVMQVMPATARSRAVNIGKINKLENNIHAGVKYLAHLRDHYFNDPTISEADRIDFILAAYNAGPTRISRMRASARRSGFDPNIWLSNVEHMARQSIGRETVEYVTNINKYIVAYKLSDEIVREREIQMAPMRAQR